MSAVNNTLQRLVGAGVDAGVGADPYMMLIFMAFQVNWCSAVCTMQVLVVLYVLAACIIA